MVAAEHNISGFKVDASRSRFVVQAFAEGLLSAFGHDPIIEVREFTCYIQCEPETLANASMALIINAPSLGVAEGVKQSDRIDIENKLHHEVLETSKYPEIKFESSNITTTRIGEGRYRARAIGNMELHGVTQKNLWINGEVSRDNEGLRVQGEFSLKQTDYGIKRVTVAGGALKVKNEVKITYDIVLNKAG